MKQYVKLLKGKRLASARGLCRSSGLLPGALDEGWASVDFLSRRKALGMWFLLERYIPRRHAALRGRGLRFNNLGRWRNGSKRPVLKHGPRSLTSMRVFGCQARPRNESECRRELLEGPPSTGPGVYRRI